MPQTWSQPQITPIDTDFEPGTDNYPLATEGTEDTEEPEDGRGKKEGGPQNRLPPTDYCFWAFTFPLLRPIRWGRILAGLEAVTGLRGRDMAEKLPVIMDNRGDNTVVNRLAYEPRYRET